MTLAKGYSYGPSNDAIPEEEFVLAQLIQSAKARDLKLSKGAFFRKGKQAVASYIPADGTFDACCAMGAARLDGGTPVPYTGVVQGNDGKWAKDDELWLTGSSTAETGYTLGRCFANAMAA